MLLITIASGRQVHTFSRFVCIGCELPGGPGQFQHLYGTLSPAAIHVGMSPDCHNLARKLGLGVLEISIAAGTWADVMAGGVVILRYHSIPVHIYIK